MDKHSSLLDLLVGDKVTSFIGEAGIRISGHLVAPGSKGWLQVGRADSRKAALSTSL